MIKKDKNKRLVWFLSVFFLIPIIFSISYAGAEMDNKQALSVSLVNQDPDPAIAGEIVELRVGIENRGGEKIDDVIAELDLIYPFEEVVGEDYRITAGNIVGYQGADNQKIIKYKVRVSKDATAGNYELKVKIYEDNMNTWYSSMLNVDVGNKENIEIVSIDKTDILPGKPTDIKFSIKNVGNSPIKHVMFSFDNEDNVILPVGSDNTQYIDYIDVNEIVDVEYTVISDSSVSAGLYKLDLDVTYDDSISGTTKSFKTKAGLYIGGGTDFDVSFSESTNGEMSFSIANIGSNEASSVSVEVPSQQGWTVSGASSVIIGNLDKGDYTVASFTLSQQSSLIPQGIDSTNRNASSQRARSSTDSVLSEEEKTAMRQRSMSSNNSSLLKINVIYTDTMGERKTVGKMVKIDSASSSKSMAGSSLAGRNVQSQSSFSKYKWYILGLVLILLGWYVYYRWNKAKKLKLIKNK